MPGFSFFSVHFWTAFIALIIIYSLLKPRSRTSMMVFVVMFNMGVAYLTNSCAMLVLPVTAVIAWLLTRWMAHCESSVKRKAVLALTILLLLAPLTYFKYAGFLLNSWNAITGAELSIGKLILPIGISFYTFQAISFAMDVYRRRFTDDVSLLEYMFYLTYFPLLMCGPITRAEVLIPQLKANKAATSEQIDTGLFLMISGIVKKAVIADYLAIYNNMVFDDPGAFAGYEVFLAVVGYACQIYLDFSGYSDMAIGMSSILGISLPDNFRFPYKSLNVSEFWRRWHIALSSWFKDYLYIPLGGSRCSLPRSLFNCMVVMLVSGLWHGASWMFVIWGGLHGIAQVIHKSSKKLFLDRIEDNWAVKALSWLLTTLFILASWVFFRCQDLDSCMTVFNKIFTDFDIAYFVPFIKARALWSAALALCIVFSLMKESWYEAMRRCFVKSHWTIKLIIFTGAIALFMFIGQSSVQPMIYAQF